jgi:hypothetical protein
MRRIIVPAFLVASCTAASADWNYAKWGMTQPQVLAASGGEGKTLAAGHGKVCAFEGQIPFAIVARKRLSEFTFDVVFCTDGSALLTSVALESDVNAKNYHAVRRSLLSQFGTPVSDERGSFAITTWNDRARGNTVRLIEIVGNARVEYRALASGF